ncbi:hypothetical protein SAMN05421788_1011113 [Filimonas lacunae]|uniref:2TM domain-containing protein n=1 Tax=Filimonas lacunae TaxID=477680 RepID=A0A173MQA8_9BACT|nr:hypothetical protein [Filimonas lacunae]BAV09676.1 hypothetical protein FLA_5729 [Filimonas lacunae]SIS77072.1 hypothetical protein SAMN05421788_1011113 [Filimonas lacunae]
MIKQDAASRTIEAIHESVRTYLKQGLTNEQIIEKLKEENLEPYYIETVIDNIYKEYEDKKNLKNAILTGSILVIVGLVINMLSYRLSENMNSSAFLLFWGIVVTGIVTIIRGMILYRS